MRGPGCGRGRIRGSPTSAQLSASWGKAGAYGERLAPAYAAAFLSNRANTVPLGALQGSLQRGFAFINNPVLNFDRTSEKIYCGESRKLVI